MNQQSNVEPSDATEDLSKHVEARLIRKRNLRLLGLLAIFLACTAAAAGYWFLYAAHFISTDNAYTSAETAPITASVGGTVQDIKVKDTQAVRKGDVLLVLDPVDAELAVTQAEVDVDRAIRRVKSYLSTDISLSSQVEAREEDVRRAQAQMSAAQADFHRAKIDLQRRQELMKTGSISGDELTRSENAFALAEEGVKVAKAGISQAAANLRSAQAAKEANSALISGVNVDQNPEVLAARVRLDQTKVDLERTVVRAPLDGIVVKRQVQVGQRIQPGVPLMAVVPVNEIYVEANFKEVQIAKLRTGQEVSLSSDLYGKEVRFSGTVEGFSGGSGSAFSAIPAQNATGNWIKVVQRLPVRIRMNPAELQKHPLKVGLSMNVRIDTRSNKD